MSVKISFLSSPKAKADTLVALAFSGKTLSAEAKKLDASLKGLVAHALTHAPAFEGKKGETLLLTLPKSSGSARLILLGVGDKKTLTPVMLEEAGGMLHPVLKSCGAKSVSVHLGEEKAGGLSTAECALRLATGLKLRSYTYTRYKKAEKTGPEAAEFVLGTAIPKKESAALDAIAAGVFLARDVMNDAPNDLYPESYAQRIIKELKPLGVDVEVIGFTQMKKLGFHAHIEVGKGSARKPCVVIMRWHGKPYTAKTPKTFAKSPLALVGKGITFDTGGYSLKPSASMMDWNMKMDMGGSAAVVGAMKSIAVRQSKAAVVGIIALAENMVAGDSYRPADIIGSMAGKTIEVSNTDAEGRLVLVDSLTYVQKTYKPKTIIDLATLTGAMVVALGEEYCGAFVNNDDLWGKLSSSSHKTGEKLWRMPLDEAYRKAMKGKISDLNNAGNMGRNAGACTAAGFLEYFIEEGVVWAHLDIAGKMEYKSDKPTVPAGAAGFGVRLLDRFIQEYYE